MSAHPYRVEDFLSHAHFLVGDLSRKRALQGAPQALLAPQVDDNLDVSLFLYLEVMRGLPGGAAAA
jgi:hypothetical protein